MSSNNEGGRNEFEKRLWEAADQLRANSKLLPSQYSGPVLGLIFLKFADHRFQNATQQFEAKGASSRRGIDESDYHSLGVMYLPEGARWGDILKLPEGADIGREISNAMTTIEDLNEDLRGALPRNYSAIENKTLIELMRVFDNIPLDTSGDLFGRIFEYFLGNFAMKELTTTGAIDFHIGQTKVIITAGTFHYLIDCKCPRWRFWIHALNLLSPFAIDSPCAAHYIYMILLFNIILK